MTKTVSLWIIAIIVSVNVACKDKKNNIVEDEKPGPLTTETQCEDWAELVYSEYILSNNVWGKGDINDYEQCIELSYNETIYIFSWNWEWVASGSGDVKAYPEIIYGWKPWSEQSTTNNLPFQLSDDHTIIITWESMDLEFTGVGNLAFDIWLTNNTPPNANNITREVMIWLENYNQVPGGQLIEQTTIDSVHFKFYKADWDWTYLAFIQTSSNTKKKINLHLFLKYLIENNYINSTEYLSAIEFGNEIIYGTGKTAIRNYTIDIK